MTNKINKAWWNHSIDELEQAADDAIIIDTSTMDADDVMKMALSHFAA